MSKVVMFSDQYLPTFPELEVPLYKEIDRITNGQVVYLLQAGDVRVGQGSFGDGTVRVEIVSGSKGVLTKLNRGDLLLMRFAYKLLGGKVAQAARSKGHKILQYDPGGVDIRFRAAPAQYLTAKSESLKAAVQKKFPNHYKKIWVTGTIHYDAAQNSHVDREQFMKSYGLDPKKKLALLTPANPGEAWMPGIQADYKKIVQIVRGCQDYEIAIKAHPLDYTASMEAKPGVIHKNEHYKGKHSWEVFAPGIAVVKPEEGYQSISACDVVLNIRSSLAIEIPLFRKPIININRNKYVTNWPFDNKVMMDIEINKLKEVLESGCNVDLEECKKYCKRECFSDDGKAYIRTAKIAISILD